MKLRTRLLLTLVALALLLSIPAIYALSRLTELRDIAGEHKDHVLIGLPGIVEICRGQQHAVSAVVDGRERKGCTAAFG